MVIRLRLVYLAIFMLLLIIAVHAKESEEDQVTFSDFTLLAGDSIVIGDYQVELIEIQSVKDGVAVMRVSKVGGSLDEQRAFLQNSANTFEGGAEDRGITVTVIDIFDDQSAKVRVEYKEGLGTARKRSSEKPRTSGLPNLVVQKKFDKDQLNVGDEVKVTVVVRNVGTGEASDIKIDDLPPLPEFSYIAGYPPKIKDKLESGESDSAIYILGAVKEGSIRVPAIQIQYSDSRKNAKSNNSEPFNVLINPRSKPDLEIRLTPSGPIPNDSKGTLNVTLINIGKAPATRINIQSEIEPVEGLEAIGLEKSYFEILPGMKESYSAELVGRKPGNYTIGLKATFQGGDGVLLKENKTEVVVSEREYKYLYLLSILPIMIIVAWMYKRYREYKY